MAADRLAFGHQCLNACVCSTSPDENVVSGFDPSRVRQASA